MDQLIDLASALVFFFIGTDRGNKYKVALEPLFDQRKVYIGFSQVEKEVAAYDEVGIS